MQCRVDAVYQIWCISDYRFEVIHIFVISVSRQRSSLTLKNSVFEPTTYCLDGFKAKLRNKFGEISLMVLKFYQVFLNFKIAAPPYWILFFFLQFLAYFLILCHQFCWNEIWCIWLERFRSCGLLSVLNFP